MRHLFSLLLAVILTQLPIVPSLQAEESKLEVIVDASETPELKEWAEQAGKLIEKWHPRVTNLLASKDFTPPQKVTLKMKKTDEGIAYTSRDVITVSSHWIEKHPDDIGLVVHELAHVIQSYPRGAPGWLVEGIADYVRWPIYEGKTQEYFRRPKAEQGYKQSYQVAAGFLLWLESDEAPGIVKKLNAACRNRKYSEEIFQQETGKTLDQLWDAYVHRD
jgi:Peptidase of plants and bacteria